MNISHFIKKNGKTNSMRSKESYVKKHFPELYESISTHVIKYCIDVTRFSEAMYYYFNNITETVTCSNPNCNTKPNFISLSSGFLKYCSSKCSNSSESVKGLKKNKFIEKYGVENPFQSSEVKESIKKTMIDRYGKDNPMKIKSIKDKMVSNQIDRSGVEWSLSKNGPAYNKRISIEHDKFANILEGIELINYSTSKNGICKFKCNDCGCEFEASKYLIYQRHLKKVVQCTKCNPIGSFSTTSIHNEITEFLDQLDIKYESNNRSILNGKELDVFIPYHNIAIEINGIYWHSELFKDKYYHLNKTNDCESKNIQLIHIFEDEWANKKDIVKSRLMSILNRSKTKIHARKCRIVELDRNTTKDFLDDNHIQGHLESSIKLGLEYNGKIVSIMTFGKLRKALGNSGSEKEFEMYRFCNIKGSNVIGGASRLLSHFIKNHNPSKIISYADRRWSSGRLYEKLGFNKVSTSDPNYWYIKNGIRYHRFNYRKSELVKRGFDPSMTEHEIMLNQKMYRLYDCGNLKYEMLINN